MDNIFYLLNPKHNDDDIAYHCMQKNLCTKDEFSNMRMIFRTLPFRAGQFCAEFPHLDLERLYYAEVVLKAPPQEEMKRAMELEVAGRKEAKGLCLNHNRTFSEYAPLYSLIKALEEACQATFCQQRIDPLPAVLQSMMLASHYCEDGQCSTQIGTGRFYAMMAPCVVLLSVKKSSINTADIPFGDFCVEKLKGHPNAMHIGTLCMNVLVEWDNAVKSLPEKVWTVFKPEEFYL